MITKAQYLDYFKSQKKRMLESGFFGSTPEPLFRYNEDFEEWLFNAANWNGCDILRRYLYNGYSQKSGIEIKEYVISDQTYIFIFTSDSFYEISWYKSRGKTDYIRKDGYPINLDEYLDICNKLGVKLGGNSE